MTAIRAAYGNMILAILGAFIIGMILGPIIIPLLRRLKFGQAEREEGLESHKKKAGTPTMGGLMFLLAVAVVVGVYSFRHTEAIPVLFLTLGYGAIGFVDDFIKVVKKRNLGLKPWQKIGLQYIVTSIFIWYLFSIRHVSFAMKVPFLKDTYLDIGIWALPLCLLIALGTVNATNLTDGVDGLASSVTACVAGFFAIVCIALDTRLSIMPVAMLGALLAFIVFNAYPAKVFMGDTGSLALGGFVVGMAYMLQMPLFIPIIGIVYLAEALSVIIQVWYFKATHGKRIFKMAPIHHHFELCGWSEVRVVAVFTIVTILFSLIAFAGVW